MGDHSITRDELISAFRYLDNLRASGAVNMFGASPALANFMGLETPQARDVFKLWMHTFSRESVEARADAALASTEGEAA